MLFRYFLFISMSMYATGFAILIYLGTFELTDDRVVDHMSAYIKFVVSVALGGALVALFMPKRKRVISMSALSPALMKRMHKVTNIVGIIAAFFCFYYVIDGGFEKFRLLGSEISALEFRFLGLNDRPKYIAIPMELSRRLLLPFAILAKFSLNRYTPNANNRILFFLLATFLTMSVINLDRGPILMFIVLLVYYGYTRLSGVFSRLLLMVAAVVMIGFTGAIFSFLQHNVLDFNFQDLKDTLYGILINRIILSPVNMSQLWVFDNAGQFINPLLLEYARLSVLWGGEYLGSHESTSYLIAPVGVMADIYRNLGATGIIPAGFVIGFLFLLVERNLQTVPDLLKIPLNFLALILAMYIHYGNIFSLGPFAILMTLLFTPWGISMLLGGRAQRQRSRINHYGLRNY
ncbi:MAG: hypothetical protein ABJL18_11005 [Hyphomicrobiales bacterium]